MIQVIGWDIGGVHTKAAALNYQGGQATDVQSASHFFEIWRDKEALSNVLRQVAAELGATQTTAMAVTMTAELSDAFRSKREGVLFVLDKVASVFAQNPIYTLDLCGHFVPLDEACQHPLDFAAANWLAGALLVAQYHRDGLWLDVGSTTTDIIPLRAGQVVARGRTDTDRLRSGELVYTGVVRTNPCAIAARVPVRGEMCRVSSEYFSITGDVYLLLGQIWADDYTCPTPDGRGKSEEFARERLARLVCADGEMLSEEDILVLARYLHEQQVEQIAEAVLQVLSRDDVESGLPVVATGLGRFLAIEAADRLGLEVVDLMPEWELRSSLTTPSLAAAFLLAQQLERECQR
jgi:(4-(4-[2-(gamma-L-glutamylamino)ethyl]phenoxymethyl)furan-2-yl)methanamine synthase